ncbi:MAG: DUF5989 family protein [Candidatus Rifleibacteriota bacterium]
MNNVDNNSKASTIAELLTFFVKRKEWLLIPIVIALLILGILLTLAQSSAVGTFMYTIF